MFFTGKHTFLENVKIHQIFLFLVTDGVLFAQLIDLNEQTKPTG